MKNFSLALAIALGMAGVAALQAQTPPAANDTKADKGGAVTVTGCFQRAVRNPALDTGNEAVGTSGTDTPIIKSDTKWVLTAPSKSSGGTVGTSGRSPKIEYRLDIGDESTYAAHEGHKVQISGTVEDGQPGAQAGTKQASGARAPLLKVQSVKMLSENCTR